MSLPVETEGSEAAAVCPYLGLADDSDLHATYTTDAHRCYHLPNPTRIATPHQNQFCLTADHPSCPIYQGEGVEATQPAPAETAEAETGMEEPLEEGGLEPASQQRPSRFAGGASRWTAGGLRRPALEGELSMRAATASLFILAAVVVAIAFVVNRQLGDDDPAAIAPAATETATQTATATPTPTEAATPTPAPTEAPTPEPTPTPAPTAPPASTYEVQSGDTCSGIALANGVSLQALLDANGLTEGDCLTIQPGQELTIPDGG